MKNVTRLVPALLLLVSGTGLAAGEASGAREELFVPPGSSTQLQAHSIPYARCDLTAPGTSQESIEVFSNGDGFISLWMQLDAGQASAELDLDCTAEDGARDHHAIRVRPGLARPITRRKHTMRPALAGDPMRATQKELRAKGFPQRPDTRDPQAMRNWLETVSRPSAIVSPRRVAGRALNRQTIVNQESPNWSGFQLTPNDGTQFVLVEGSWVVPSVVRAERPEKWNGRQYSSAWVGLDAGDPGIFQAGTQHNVLHAVFFDVSVYNAWTEVFPARIYVVPDFEVIPGDHVMFRVYASNRNGEIDGKGEFMAYDIHDYARKQFLTGDAFAKFAGFQGNTAQWIVERQTPITADGTFLPLEPLPNYGIMFIDGVSVLDSAHRRHNLSTATNTLHKIVMLDFDVVDGGALTSAIQRTSSNSMKFTWVDPQQ